MWFLSIKSTTTRICFTGFAFLLFYPFNAIADQRTLPNPWELSRDFPTQIRSLTSDEQAVDFFRSLQEQSSQRLRTQKHIVSDPIPPMVEEAASTLMAALSLKSLLKDIRDSTRHLPDPSSALSKVNADPSIPWLFTKLPLDNLQLVQDLHILLLKWTRHPIEPLPLNHVFNQFSSYLDGQSHPLSEDSSWIRIFREEGLHGIENRLSAFWANPHASTLPDHTDSRLRRTYEQHYQAIRLVPLFERELLRQTIRLEEQATQVAWDQWNLIQQWLDQQRNEAGLRRLCGTWRWIVHNHQNHGDHKMTLTFSSSPQSSPSFPSPSHITVKGNTVYLQWTFPQGTQEDSLLLSKNDTLLEGTFTNSTGPYGTISGKRISACPS